MNKERRLEQEPDYSYVFSPLNPRLIRFDANLNYFIKTDRGFVLYGDESKRDNILNRLENGTLPQLFVELTYKRNLYKGVAEYYLKNLKETLDKENVDRKEVANILVEWVDISLIEMGVEDESLAIEHLDKFVSELLIGYGEDNIISLLNEVKNLDFSSAQHSVEMMIFTLIYFESLPKESARLNKIGALSALLHDIGKKKIGDDIILKPGPLSEDEYKTAKTHVDYGVEILNNIDFQGNGFSVDEANMIIRAAREHHEREDGSGYPLGLKKGEISIFGKIMAVLDIFTAVTTDTRSYRRAVSQKEAMDILNQEVMKGHINREAVNQLEIALRRLQAP